MTRRRLAAGVDQADLFERLFGGRDDVFWLDGGHERMSVMGEGLPVDLHASRTLDRLRLELAGIAAAGQEGAGLVGWFGYEFQDELDAGAGAVWQPGHGAFVRHDWLLEVSPAGDVDLVVSERADADALTGELLRRLTTPIVPAGTGTASEAIWSDDRTTYLAKIAEAQAHIRAGDAYVLCLTTSVRVTGHFEGVAVYRRLRGLAGSARGGLLRMGGITIVSASPESFLEVGTDRTVTTRPIKGTRRRHPDPRVDGAIAAELATDEKELAENLMIVDLMRNDLSRVCVAGTIDVPAMFEVEPHPMVHQLVSTVTGTLSADRSAIDAVAACFPAGSMTGAPKPRAVQLLRALEGRPRGPYSGAFGRLDASGTMDLAMTIRTIVIDAAGASVGVGGGITALSDPESEWAEVHLKAAAALEALGAVPHLPADQGSSGRSAAAIGAS